MTRNEKIIKAVKVGMVLFGYYKIVQFHSRINDLETLTVKLANDFDATVIQEHYDNEFEEIVDNIDDP